MRKAGFATYVQVAVCPTCKGKGKLIDVPCTNCHGSGLVRRRRKITVKIPMGIDEGYQLRLRGEGEMTANEGEPGDLYVVVHVKQNAQFIREGDDLWHVAIITFPQQHWENFCSTIMDQQLLRCILERSQVKP
jgi:molecular chaperone DnaJ